MGLEEVALHPELSGEEELEVVCLAPEDVDQVRGGSDHGGRGIGRLALMDGDAARPDVDVERRSVGGLELELPLLLGQLREHLLIGGDPADELLERLEGSGHRPSSQYCSPHLISLEEAETATEKRDPKETMVSSRSKSIARKGTSLESIEMRPYRISAKAAVHDTETTRKLR